MLFNYTGVDQSGGEAKGSIDAISLDVAIASLQRRGLVIKEVKPAGNKSFFSRFASDENGNMVHKAEPTLPSFPSSNRHVISVGAVDAQGEIASYSSRDCDVYADGEAFGQRGTSFASARVSAMAANSLAQNPTATIPQLIQILQQQHLAFLF